MVIKRLCFACTKSGKIVRFVLKNCTFRFRDYKIVRLKTGYVDTWNLLNAIILWMRFIVSLR